jgi:RHS repeat-associated protein
VNSVRTDFLYDGVNPVQELSGISVIANMLSGLRTDEYFTRTDARGTHTLLTDALGSTLVLTDKAGTVSSAYTYELYGRTITTGTAHPNSFQYTGRENDGTGLYYYRARYYLPSIQRFISEDPLGFLGRDINLYGYVISDPINFIDPIGLKTTIVVNRIVGIGYHVGFHIDNKGDPRLFDPGGSYEPLNVKRDGNEFRGDQANLQPYINFQSDGLFGHWFR